MQSKSFVLIALSATAAVASPFNKRHDHSHYRFHGTASFSLQASATGGAVPELNDTNQIVGDAQSSSSSCLSTSYLTSTTTNFVTVTASVSASVSAQPSIVETGSVSAGAFYGGRSWSRSDAASQSTAGVPSVSVPVVSSVLAPSAVQQSTTFMSIPSAAKSSVVVSSSAVSSAVASSVASTGSSGGKRGISFNDASLVAAFGSSVSWSYNWGATESGSLSVPFVPMMWGTSNVDSFASQVGSATHVLSFNEPDLAAQSDIDPVTAATLHRQGMASLVGKVEIGSPAVTNGATTSPPMGVNWLDQFFTACGDNCPVDFVAYHWYADASSIDDFKSHTQDIINVAAKYGVTKVWLTEFEPSGTADAQAAFMTEAVAFLESTSAVERYAAFMASDGTMLTGNTLNSVGSAYAEAS